MAAAWGRSPRLADLAASVLSRANDTYPAGCAWRALETQRSDGAIQVLRRLWQQGEVAALRALGRCRDRSITDDAVSLLSADDAGVRLDGARVLRDVRDPRAIGPLLDLVASADDDQLVAAAAAGLVALGVDGLAEPFRRAADRSGGPLARLLVSWADRLDDPAG